MDIKFNFNPKNKDIGWELNIKDYMKRSIFYLHINVGVFLFSISCIKAGLDPNSHVT